jgi:hypothetical protein
MLLDKHLLFVISCACCWFGSISSAFLHPMVSFHGHTRVTFAARRTMGGGIHHVSERPPDPKSLLDAATLEERVHTVSLETLSLSSLCLALYLFGHQVLTQESLEYEHEYENVVSSWIGGKEKSPSFVLRVPDCRPIQGFRTVSSQSGLTLWCMCACAWRILYLVPW